MQKDFLVELGTEELPPKALAKLAVAFCNGIKEGLDKASLNYDSAKYFASPRRLAVYVGNLQTKQADQTVERRGPALTAAFKEDGCPTPAAEGFAKSCGTSVDNLETLETDKGSWLVYKLEQKGEKTTSLLPEIVNQSLQRLPVPKRMRWGTSTHDFVRPVHWLLALFGEEQIDMTLFGHRASDISFGHRFHSPEAITIPQPSAYENLLETQGKVLVDFEKRKATIKAQVEEAAKDLGGIAVIDDALLTEVTGLVEWPVAVVGKFEERFLNVPNEALVSAMKNHQKYFHVVDKEKKLLPYFITISNIESSNIESVRHGNERVIRPRLSDAEFFWEQDNKKKLDSFLIQLEKVVFQNKLGSLKDKVNRVQKLSESIASSLGKDQRKASRAALLSKCDLMSEMVGEFPELQGIMGQYYALKQGEDSEVAKAINEQYMPRFSGDSIPETESGAIVSIADKLDTVVGIFGIGQAPTGDKDPFALRRSVIGLMRVIIEKNMDLDIFALIQHSIDNFEKIGLGPDTKQHVYQFMLDRLKGYYSDKGISYDVFEAVVVTKPHNLLDMEKRISAINHFKTLPQAESLASANKRINNILKKANPQEISKTVDDRLLVEEAEKKLAKVLDQVINASKEHVKDKNYEATLAVLAGLKEPVDEFFDNVMVNSDIDEQKNNRLGLLNRLSQQFLAIADIGQLQINNG